LKNSFAAANGAFKEKGYENYTLTENKIDEIRNSRSYRSLRARNLQTSVHDNKNFANRKKEKETAKSKK
jgi:hypothetical protein